MLNYQRVSDFQTTPHLSESKECNAGMMADGYTRTTGKMLLGTNLPLRCGFLNYQPQHIGLPFKVICLNQSYSTVTTNDNHNYH
jgi:hypothetical protein